MLFFFLYINSNGDKNIDKIHFIIFLYIKNNN